MAWKHYRLLFRLESPLHVGYRKVGNLMQTRRYVPGKNLWAAMTVRIVWLAGQGNSARAYQAVGETLKKHVRFGYLWPAHATEKDEHGRWILPTTPHFPWWKEARWDYLYLDSRARTAIDPDIGTAAEGMLYDVEYIMPYTREGNPVYLIGDLWVRHEMPSHVDVNGTTIPLQWQEALQRLQIGGERTYGWGRIALETELEPSADHMTTWQWKWCEEHDDVILHNRQHKHLPAHALAAPLSDEQPLAGIQGPVEPWLGWEYRGQFRLSDVRILYEPGARISRSFQARLHPWGYLYQSGL